MRIGIHRALPEDALSLGAWESTADGTRVWRLALRSPGSEGIRVEFRHFDVGTGKVWLHDNGSAVAGPYTGQGTFGNGRFWSATLPGDSATLEYEPGAEASAASELPFEIRTLAHRVTSAPRAGFSSRSGREAGVPDPADYCHLDPNCYPEWKPAMSMVARLAFEEDGDEYSCSGALVATRDDSFKPYLLTAGHCIHSEDAARSLEAYWTYQTSACGAAPPASLASSAKSTAGAHLVDYGTISEGDYSLVLLKDVPSGVTFSGWDISDPPQGTPLVGIHHPVGSWKRISFGERVPDETVDVEGAIAPGDYYLEVQWDKGRTEPGSSGSPLFSSPGVIVGSLTYGPAAPGLSACQIEPSVDGYGRFSNAYTHLKDYLENLPAAAVAPDRQAVSFAFAAGARPAAQTVRLTTADSASVIYKLRADAPWIQLSPVSGGTSAKAPAQVAISVDAAQVVQPGEYASTVTVLAGAADPVYINVTVKVTAGRSDIAATVSPNPVPRVNGQWQFAIQLAERAGVATQLTGLKINAVDYSPLIPAWFGTNSIGANGTLSAPLTATGPFPPGPQYLEFSGTDDSGATWYRTATVKFQ